MWIQISEAAVWGTPWTQVLAYLLGPSPLERDWNYYWYCLFLLASILAIFKEKIITQFCRALNFPVDLSTKQSNKAKHPLINRPWFSGLTFRDFMRPSKIFVSWLYLWGGHKCIFAGHRGSMGSKVFASQLLSICRKPERSICRFGVNRICGSRQFVEFGRSRAPNRCLCLPDQGCTCPDFSASQCILTVHLSTFCISVQ